MRVSLAYAEPANQLWLRLDLPEGATVRDAIEQSGILVRFPQIDLSMQKVGIFGKVAALDKTLDEGDRIEIYRPIIANPNALLQEDEDE